jgi:hypothetical protein
MTAVDFNLPLNIDSGEADLRSFQIKNKYIGYTPQFTPLYNPSRSYILDCPFDNVVSLGTCIEDDLSGSGNVLEWYNSGENSLWRIAIDGSYGKSSRYINGSGYFYKNNIDFLKDNTFFGFDFRLNLESTVTLMELSQVTSNRFIKVEIRDNGQLYITSNGTEIQSRHRFVFDNQMYLFGQHILNI